MANTPISDFPAASSVNASDVLAGVQDGVTKKFSFAIVLNWLKQQLESMFVPTSRKINGKDLSSDITLDASDIGAVDASDVGIADGVAGLDSNGKVPSSQLPPISSDAADITYDPTTSGASATNVQDALDEAFDDLDGKQDSITASGILKGDGAGGVSAAVAGTDYQAPLTIDATPTANSTNPVQSGGVYTDVRTRVPVYGMGKNLLDNWYFGNPVNQRGQSSYVGAGADQYSIDRWYINRTSSSLAINTGYVTLTPPSGTTATLTQRPQIRYRFADFAGRKMTISALLSNGELKTATNTLPSTAPASNTSLIRVNFTAGGYIQLGYNNGFYCLFQTGTGIALGIKAAKLELGTEQTLAHQENGVWVLNEIPDYETELIKCQTSTADPSDTFANKSLATEQQLAYVETGTTASRAYSVGEYFCWNGLLYRVTTAISSGGTITPGANCEQVTGGGFNDILSAPIFTGNCNDLPAGFTYAYSSATNIPAAGGSYFVITMRYSNHGAQIAIRRDGNAAYYRRCSSGSWSSTWVAM